MCIKWCIPLNLDTRKMVRSPIFTIKDEKKLTSNTHTDAFGNDEFDGVPGGPQDEESQIPDTLEPLVTHMLTNLGPKSVTEIEQTLAMFGQSIEPRLLHMFLENLAKADKLENVGGRWKVKCNLS